MNLGIIRLAAEGQAAILPDTPNISSVHLFSEVPCLDDSIDAIFQNQFRLESMSLLIALIKRFDLMIFQEIPFV